MVLSNIKNHDFIIFSTSQWTQLRSGLFGWRVRSTEVGKTDKEKQTGAELKSAKYGMPDVSKIKLDEPAKSLPRGKNINTGIYIKRKCQDFESADIQHSGWENNTRGGVEIEGKAY